MRRVDSGYPYNFRVYSWVFKNDESETEAKTNRGHWVCLLLVGSPPCTEHAQCLLLTCHVSTYTPYCTALGLFLFIYIYIIFSYLGNFWMFNSKTVMGRYTFLAWEKSLYDLSIPYTISRPIPCVIILSIKLVRSVLILFRAQSYVTPPVASKWAGKKMPFCPSLRVTKICRNCGTNNISPWVQIII